jgi:hypothetical protein
MSRYAALIHVSPLPRGQSFGQHFLSLCSSRPSTVPDLTQILLYVSLLSIYLSSVLNSGFH